MRDAQKRNSSRTNKWPVDAVRQQTDETRCKTSRDVTLCSRYCPLLHCWILSTVRLNFSQTTRRHRHETANSLKMKHHERSTGFQSFHLPVSLVELTWTRQSCVVCAAGADPVLLFASDISGWLIPLSARSKVCTCDRSSAETVGSNPTGGMDACLL